jgi:DUF1680 family protein
MRTHCRPYPVVVDTSQSRYARLKPVPLTAVTLADEFWAPRIQTNRESTLPEQYRLLEETGRIDNFRRAAGKKDIPFQGRYYNDSDVYKWLEAVAWTMASDAGPTIKQMADAVIAEIAAAQGPDGYLNTYFTFDQAAQRWTNLRDMHELYCAGHLIQAAVAHHRATGQDSLLHVALRLADHICEVFGPSQEGKRPATPGHEEIEMALLELARETGALKYQRQAQFFLDSRGKGLIGGSPYHQDHRPFREMERMVGHAVRSVYLNAGATDIYAETGDTALRDALDRLWQNMATRQLYISGGIGSRYAGEAFGADYELPNARAYAETCAAIGSIMWNWRMLALEGDARYADLLETTLYNGFLAGFSLDGHSYFYQNPLADDGTQRRQPWFDCACCPPNIARLLASLPGYFCSLSDDGIWVHLYAEESARVPQPNGGTVTLVQHTRYPWDGEIAIEVEGQGLFSLYLRIPAWCMGGAVLEVNGNPFANAVLPGSYALVRRTWQTGDSVRLHLPMPVRLVECHPYVQENAGRLALMRGPLLYCLEQADNAGFDLRDVTLIPDASFSTVYRPELLGGVVVLRNQSLILSPDDDWNDLLYRTAPSERGNEASLSAEISAIPYYAWANREPGAMRVWLKSQPSGRQPVAGRR